MFEYQNIKIANKYFQKAFDSQMQGDFVEARNNYLTSIEIHPTAEAHVNLGWTFSKDQNYEEAIKQCHRALSIDASYGMAYSDIGYYLMQQENFDEAVIWLEEALQLEDFEGKFYTHYNLGRAYEKKGIWQKGIEEYDKSLLLKPGFKLAKNKLLCLSARLN